MIALRFIIQELTTKVDTFSPKGTVIFFVNFWRYPTNTHKIRIQRTILRAISWLFVLIYIFEPQTIFLKSSCYLSTANVNNAGCACFSAFITDVELNIFGQLAIQTQIPKEILAIL